jgi:hypothetical protein
MTGLPSSQREHCGRRRVPIQGVLGFFLVLLLAGCTPMVPRTPTSPPAPALTAIPTAASSTPLVATRTASPSPSPALTGSPMAAASPSPAGSPSPVTPVTGVSPSTASPLKRRDAPPSGVNEQVGFWLGAGGKNDEIRLSPGATHPPGALTIATQNYLRLDGFAPQSDVDISIRRPDQAAMQNRVRTSSQGTAEWLIDVVPGDPLGTYTVVATQGASRAENRFIVSTPREPTMLILPGGGPPGTTFQLMLAGFPPRQTISVRLYCSTGTTRQSTAHPMGEMVYRYLTTLPLVGVDQRGEATYSLQTESDDPRATYRVVTEPPLLYFGMGDFHMLTEREPPRNC